MNIHSIVNCASYCMETEREILRDVAQGLK